MIKILTLLCLLSFSCSERDKVYEVTDSNGKIYRIDNIRGRSNYVVGELEYTDQAIRISGNFVVIETVPDVIRP